jgi:hypothetical protein
MIQPRRRETLVTRPEYDIQQVIRAQRNLIEPNLITYTLFIDVFNSVSDIVVECEHFEHEGI